MHAPCSFDYVIIRVVPRVDRGEQINAGVIVSCPTQDFLAAKVALDEARLRAIAPDADVAQIARALAVYPLIAAGHPDGGPIAALPRTERFHWLISPRSTILQTSAAHAALGDDPAAALDALMDKLVATPR